MRDGGLSPAFRKLLRPGVLLSLGLYLASLPLGFLSPALQPWLLFGLLPRLLGLLLLALSLKHADQPAAAAPQPRAPALGFLARGPLVLTISTLMLAAAVLLRAYQLLGNDLRFNLAMVLLLGFFITAAIALAAAFTLLFVSVFDWLETDPPRAFVQALPLLLLLALPLGLLRASAAGVGGGLGGWPVVAPQLAAALDLSLLGGLAVLLALERLGALVGRRSPVLLASWKFLRSQKLLPLPYSAALQRMRRQVPQPLDRFSRTFLGLLVLSVLLALPLSPLGALLGPASLQARLEPLRWGLGLVAVATLWLLVLGKRLSPRDSLLGLLTLALAGLASVLGSPSTLGLPPWTAWVLPLLVGLGLLPPLLLVLLRLVLARRHATGGLAPALDPALAPSLGSRLARGVGPSMFISVVGTAVGVWALIVVLSVMKGFSEDLTGKLLRTREHVMVASDEPGGIKGAAALGEGLAADPRVAAFVPYAEGNVMVASDSNIGMNITLRGLLPGTHAASRLEEDLVSGALVLLTSPHLLALQQHPYGDWPTGATENLGTPPPPPHTQDTPDTPTPEPSSPPLAEAPTGELLPAIPGVGQGASKPSVRVLPPVYLGSELASSLGVTAGSKVDLIAPDAELGPAGKLPKARTFAVAGVFSTGLYELDMKLACTSLWEAQRFLNLGPVVNRLEIRLRHLEDAPALAVELRGRLPGADVKDYRELNRNLFSALELEWVVMFFVLGFVILIASFSTVSGLLMVIRQRASSVAILRTMGFRRRDLLGTFLWLGALLGFMGAASGIILGVASCIVVENLGIALPREYYIRELPVSMSAWSVLLIGGSAWGLSVLASVYPAIRASRLSVVQGLGDGK